MSANNRLEIPGQINIAFAHHRECAHGITPAHAAVAVVQAPGQLMMHAFGGLTKLEHAACALAAGYPADSDDEIVERANRLLAACERRQKEQEQAGAK